MADQSSAVDAATDAGAGATASASVDASADLSANGGVELHASASGTSPADESTEGPQQQPTGLSPVEARSLAPPRSPIALAPLTGPGTGLGARRTLAPLSGGLPPIRRTSANSGTGVDGAHVDADTRLPALRNENDPLLQAARRRSSAASAASAAKAAQAALAEEQANAQAAEGQGGAGRDSAEQAPESPVRDPNTDDGDAGAANDGDANASSAHGSEAMRTGRVEAEDGGGADDGNDDEATAEERAAMAEACAADEWAMEQADAQAAAEAAQGVAAGVYGSRIDVTGGVGESKAQPSPSSEWAQLVDEQGNTYYYNYETQKSVWERPEGFTPVSGAAPRPDPIDIDGLYDGTAFTGAAPTEEDWAADPEYAQWMEWQQYDQEYGFGEYQDYYASNDPTWGKFETNHDYYAQTPGGGNKVVPMYSPPAGASPSKLKAASRRMIKKERTFRNVHHVDEENLEGDDWLETSWVRPSVTKAYKHRSRYVYRGGQASVLWTSIEDISSIVGYGLGLYFKFLKTLAIAFFIMTLLSLPIIFINVSGERVTDEERDALSISITSLGNNGLSAEATQLAARTCEGDACDVTYVQVFGKQIRSSTASIIITLCDVLYSAFFLAFVRYFHKLIDRVKAEHLKEVVTAADYAVRVTGLPRDAEKGEILHHFNELFRLDRRDWVHPGYCWGFCFRKQARPTPAELNQKRRREDMESGRGTARVGVDPATGRHRPNFHHQDSQHHHIRYIDPSPVTDVSNSGSKMYLGTFIAEVSLVHPNGDIIRRYLRLKKLQLRVLKARAKAKKYNTGSVYADTRKFKKAFKAVHKIEEKLHKTKVKSIKKKVASDACIGAYVTFNEQESWKRCILDYGRYKGWRGVFMPEVLKFRGLHKLKVERCSDPSNVKWENLDTHWYEQLARRMVAFLIMLAMLIVSIAVIFFVTLNKIEASKRLPDFALCSTELPAVAWNSYDFPTQASIIRDRSLDDDCGAERFAVFFEGSPVASANTSTAPLCRTPCVNPVDVRSCTALNNKTFAVNTIVGCYCKTALQRAMSDHGLIAGAQHLQETEADLCITFAEDYLKTQGLLVLAAVSIVLINAGMRGFMRWLATFERHHSVSAEQASMTLKVFLALFMNTGLVTLLVNANIPDIALDLQGVGLFAGEFTDFEPRWYTVVGVSIVLTILINSIGPQISPLFKWLVVAPMQRWCYAKRCVTQEELNLLYEGHIFNIAIRYPISLNTLFVALTYCSGLPILLPIACVSFALTFWVDKVSLLRLYNLPPRFDERLALLATSLMPWACFLHLLFAVWMYGNNDILRSDVFSTSLIGLGENSESAYDKWKTEVEVWDPLGVVPRLVRANVLPVVLFAFVLLLWLISGSVVKVVMRRILKTLTCGLCGSARMRSDVTEHDEVPNPPFTGFYSEVLSEAELTSLISHGTVSHKDDRQTYDRAHHGGRYDLRTIDGHPQRIRVWMNAGKSHGRAHAPGDRMLTWEVIAETTLFSYDMIANAKYRRAMIAMLKDKKFGGVKRRRRLPKPKPVSAMAAVVAAARGAGFMDNHNSGELGLSGAQRMHAPPPPPDAEQPRAHAYDAAGVTSPHQYVQHATAPPGTPHEYGGGHAHFDFGGGAAAHTAVGGHDQAGTHAYSGHEYDEQAHTYHGDHYDADAYNGQGYDHAGSPQQHQYS